MSFREEEFSETHRNVTVILGDALNDTCHSWMLMPRIVAMLVTKPCITVMAFCAARPILRTRAVLSWLCSTE